MPHDVHFPELLPAYALACLDEDEANLVANHLVDCPICQAELRSFQAIVDQLALTAPDVEPSPDLKRRLMARLQSVHQTIPASTRARPRTLRQHAIPIWGIVSLLLILVLAVSNLLLWQQVKRLAVAATAEGMRAFPLSSTGLAPDATGFVVVSSDGHHGALVVDNLPPLDPQQQYQLWLIRDGQRSSGAAFSVDQEGYGGTRISAQGSLFEYSAVGITAEPVEGSPGPTSEDVLTGSLFNP